MNTKHSAALLGLILLALPALGIVLAGCATPPKTVATGVATPAGAQLWAQNCGHCHNFRSPNMYSDSQWDVIVLHMRVRGNLTANEHKQILAFLKSAH